jgi:phosphoribosylpyrophosphate synthetase
LRLVSGPRDCDLELTKLIAKTLEDDFFFSGAKVIPRNPSSTHEDKFASKGRKSFVFGNYNNSDPRVDIGETTFSTHFKRDAIYLVMHMYNFAELNGSVANAVFQALLLGRTLKKEGGAVKKLSLVSPIDPFGLNHSERRNRRVGFIEGEALEMFCDFMSQCGYNELISICPHSTKTTSLLDDYGIKHRSINPFVGPALISTNRMGPFLFTDHTNTVKRDDYETQLARLMPFVTFLKNRYESKTQDLIYVATDDSCADNIIEHITYALTGDRSNILGINKLRYIPGEVETGGIRSWSTATRSGLEGKICLLFDDKKLSGITTYNVAKMMKESGASEVGILIANDESYDHSILDQLEGNVVDYFVFLPTNPNSALKSVKDPRIIHLPVQYIADPLASRIFDSYVRLRDEGGDKV